MKIEQLLSSIKIQVTNEERGFIKKHDSNIRISSLDDRDKWIAQNLVRKGLYTVGEDNNTLKKHGNHC